MVYSNYTVNPKVTGFYGNKQTYRLSDGKFILNLKQNETIKEADSDLEKINSEKAELQNVEFNYPLITKPSTNVSTDDPITKAERTKADEDLKEFTENLNNINESAEAYKNLPNADVEIYERFQNEITNFGNNYQDLFIKKNNLLDDKASIQAKINDLTVPTPPNKEDYVTTNTLSDGMKVTVFDEEGYNSAMLDYEGDMRFHQILNTKYENEMNEVTNKLNHIDMQINMLKSNAESLQKDFSTVTKIQDMINNDDNSNIVSILKNQQEYLSSKVSDNINLRNTTTKVQEELFAKEVPTPPNKKDFPLTKVLPDGLKETVFDEEAYNNAYNDYLSQKKEYDTAVKECNKKTLNAERQISNNNIDIERLLYDSDVFALYNELETNGTGSKAMNKIIAKSSAEYNQILNAKKAETEIFYNTFFTEDAPTPPSLNDFETEEEYNQAMNLYNYQRSMYNWQQQMFATRQKIAESRIQAMDSELAQIRRMLFGVPV